MTNIIGSFLKLFIHSFFFSSPSRFRFASFYENLQALATEKLICPRCNSNVTDRHGICSNCRENAFQCRQCRNINYENPQAFFCIECGFSKWVRLDFSLMGRPSFSIERIQNEQDRKKALELIQTEYENANIAYKQLALQKEPLAMLLSSVNEGGASTSTNDNQFDAARLFGGGSGLKVNKQIEALAQNYEQECKANFEAMSKSIQLLIGTRREILRYDAQISPKNVVVSQSNNSTTTTSQESESIDSMDLEIDTATAATSFPSNCFGCATSFFGLCLRLLEPLALNSECRTLLLSENFVNELLTNNLSTGPSETRNGITKKIETFF